MFLIPCVCIATIILNGSIFVGIREKILEGERFRGARLFVYELMSCGLCLGFWVGAIVFCIENEFFNSSRFYLDNVYFSAKVSVATFFLDKVMRLPDRFSANLRE